MRSDKDKPRWSPQVRAFRWAILIGVIALGIVAVPIIQGYFQGPVFPVLDPSPWEALKAVGRHMAFRP